MGRGSGALKGLTQNRRKKIKINRPFLDQFRCVPGPWDFSSGLPSHLSLNQFLGEVSSSQIEESQNKRSAPLS